MGFVSLSDIATPFTQEDNTVKPHQIHANTNIHARHATKYIPTTGMQTPTSTTDVNGQKSKLQMDKLKENLDSLHHETQTQISPTPVNYADLSTLLDKYNDREFIINGFKNGFNRLQRYR